MQLQNKGWKADDYKNIIMQLMQNPDFITVKLRTANMTLKMNKRDIETGQGFFLYLVNQI